MSQLFSGINGSFNPVSSVQIDKETSPNSKLDSEGSIGSKFKSDGEVGAHCLAISLPLQICLVSMGVVRELSC